MACFYAYFRKPVSLVLIAFGSFKAAAQQVTIHGTVFNMYKTVPLEAVSVLCSCGAGVVTDSIGNYSITVDQSDSLRFSYLGRATQMFPVSMMNPTTGFDIALHVKPTDLGEVKVAPRNYRMDSIQNRKDYEKIFNYKKPGVSITDGQSGSGVGLDLDELINVFRFKRNRRLAAFQERLVEDEQYKFVSHRFTLYTVKKITGLDSDARDTFMLHYRPSFWFTKTASDYEFYDYIKLAYQDYKNHLSYHTLPAKKEEPVHGVMP